MKTLIFAILVLVLVSFNVKSQQLPNGDFEIWTHQTFNEPDTFLSSKACKSGIFKVEIHMKKMPDRIIRPDKHITTNFLTQTKCLFNLFFTIKRILSYYQPIRLFDFLPKISKIC